MIDIAGNQYGRLMVTVGHRIEGPHVSWFCRCDCGTWGWFRANNLRMGASRSCGCLAKEMTGNRYRGKHLNALAKRKIGAANRHHGHRVRGRTATYATWICMKERCTKQGHKSYRRYGGRGISVGDRWRSFEHFLGDMGERPDGKTLDRINNDGNYEHGNCRWATPKEQAMNRRTVS